MSKIFIPAYSDDIHAIAVADALTKKGHEAVLWMGSDFPTQMEASYFVNGGLSQYKFKGTNIDFVENDIDVVWLRRPAPPIHAHNIHKADRQFVEDESEVFFLSIWYTIGQNAFWANPFHAARRANSKHYQLQQAHIAGLKHPNTLMSNSPTEIRAFVEKNGTCIYKPYNQQFWKEDKKTSALWATEISLDMLQDDVSLKMAPGIYQEKCEKSYELRLTFMGTHCVPVKLNSQDVDAARNDWRASVTDIAIELYDLPDEIYTSCRNLMKQFGLSFAIFDFIVTPDNEFVFLEINEMGQFLWIEEMAPEIKMLDMFTEFLINGSEDFTYSQPTNPISFMDYFNNEYSKRSEYLTSTHTSRKLTFVTEE